jgi:hypothetical protein
MILIIIDLLLIIIQMQQQIVLMKIKSFFDGNINAPAKELRIKLVTNHIRNLIK